MINRSVIPVILDGRNRNLFNETKCVVLVRLILKITANINSNNDVINTIQFTNPNYPNETSRINRTIKNFVKRNAVRCNTGFRTELSCEMRQSDVENTVITDINITVEQTT